MDWWSAESRSCASLPTRRRNDIRAWWRPVQVRRLPSHAWNTGKRSQRAARHDGSCAVPPRMASCPHLPKTQFVRLWASHLTRNPPFDHRSRHGRIDRGQQTGAVTVGVLLTVAAARSRTRSPRTRRESVRSRRPDVQVPGRHDRRAEGRGCARLRGGAAEPVIPFTQPGSLTRVYAVTSSLRRSASPR